MTTRGEVITLSQYPTDVVKDPLTTSDNDLFKVANL